MLTMVHRIILLIRQVPCSPNCFPKKISYNIFSLYNFTSNCLRCRRHDANQAIGNTAQPSLNSAFLLRRIFRILMRFFSWIDDFFTCLLFCFLPFPFYLYSAWNFPLVFARVCGLHRSNNRFCVSEDGSRHARPPKFEVEKSLPKIVL